MRILILENELYLAQNISNKLTNLDHQCYLAKKLEEIPEDTHFDCIIFSYNIPNLNIEKLLYKYDGAIFIILVTYISYSTVFEPLEKGVHDYIFKPFSMKELINKITYLSKFNKLVDENKVMRDMSKNLFKFLGLSYLKDLRFPLYMNGEIVKIEVFAVNQANNLKLSVKHMDFKDILSRKTNLIRNNNALIIAEGYDTLNEEEREEADIFMKKYINVITITKNREDAVSLITNTTNMQDDTIDSYVKSYILSNEMNINDTKIAQNLGISRKNLWEKRKKYGIQKSK